MTFSTNSWEEWIASVPNSDHSVLMGDQNAEKVRRDTESWRGVLMRQEETPHRNRCTLCDGLLHSQLQLVAINTFFCQHMEIHKQTWGKYIMKGWVLDHRLVHIVGSGVADVRVIRGADVRSDPLSVDES